MVMLAEHYDFVIGGDPDRDTIDLAILDAVTGAVLGQISDQADGAGYQRVLSWAARAADGRRVWALEGTGSFAAGLVAVLAEAGEDVVEIQNKKRSGAPRATGLTPSMRRGRRSPKPIRPLLVSAVSVKRSGRYSRLDKGFW
jgi:hypothetical protein